MKAIFNKCLLLLLFNFIVSYVLCAQNNDTVNIIVYKKISCNDTLEWTTYPSSSYSLLYRLKNGEKIFAQKTEGNIVDVFFSGDTCSIINSYGQSYIVNIYLAKDTIWQAVFNAYVGTRNMSSLRGSLKLSLLNAKTIYMRANPLTPLIYKGEVDPYYKDRIIRINVEENSAETFDIVDKQYLNEPPPPRFSEFPDIKDRWRLYDITKQKSLKK